MAVLTGDGKEFPKELFDLLEERRKKADDKDLNLLIGVKSNVMNGVLAGKYAGKYVDAASEESIIIGLDSPENVLNYISPRNVTSILVQLSDGALNALYFGNEPAEEK